MAGSCSELREFRVEVPSVHIHRYGHADYQRWVDAMSSIADGCEWRKWQAPDRDVWIITGSGTPLFVAGLMALAQGHDLDVISEQIEALV